MARFEVSEGHDADGESFKRINGVTFPVSLGTSQHGTHHIIDGIVLFTLDFRDSRVWGPRAIVDMSWDSRSEVDLCYFDNPGEGLRYKVPLGYGSVIQEAIDAVKSVDWKGSLPEYVVFQRYFARRARQTRVRES